MTPKHIILHHSLTKDSQTVSWAAIRRYHVDTLGWRDIGYHYGLEQVGEGFEIFKGRMDNETGAHCQQSGMNQSGLGICCVGNYDLAPPPAEMLTLLCKLLRSLCVIYSIPVGSIHTHSTFASYKTCPGKMFPFKDVISKVAGGV